MDIPNQLAQEMNLALRNIEAAIDLLDDGASVPFIARYRKEVTGNLDETQIRDISHRLNYFRDLEDRKLTIIDSIAGQGKLTDDLKRRIESVVSKTELEDLYLPFKPRRVTRASRAREAGLEPLAQWLLTLEHETDDLMDQAAAYINADKGFDTAGKALQGACDILAEDVSNDPDLRRRLRELAMGQGFFVSTVRKDCEGAKTKFEMYYDYREPVNSIPSHRMLALFRGERENVLRLKLEIPEKTALALIEKELIRYFRSAAAQILKETASDCLQRLLQPATETEVRKEIRLQSEKDAIRVFGDNLRELLLASPAGQKPVLGIDPGFRTGCKLAALGPTGQFLEYKAIFPHEPQREVEGAKGILTDMIVRNSIALIAIGNGTASRETESFVRCVLNELSPESRPVCLIVSEAGASVYSASEAAAAEFPDLDVTIRGAVSIGRRLQDPLSELVKIDPKSIGVGQYQHDVDQKMLKTALDEVVESCVNSVGVNLNLASEALLKYVSGLTPAHARNIIKYRNQKGPFTSRSQLKKVDGVGSKTFEQAAGFLRIPDGCCLLDNSAVHPEHYGLVEKMAASLNTSLEKMIGNAALLRSLDRNRFVSDDAGLLTIEDILQELEKPGRDPRSTFQYARFLEDVDDLADLSPGMILEGRVSNVTNFGAFVDIGVHQDGLVHISEMAERYVHDPRQIVKVGQVVRVRVLSVDPDLKRIALSLRLPRSD